tara:strand:- start:4910 stop:5659 length:750 start_codon:yes stop_codon:yes gene_type:complete
MNKLIKNMYDFLRKVKFLKHVITMLRKINPQYIKNLILLNSINKKYLVGNGVEIGPGGSPYMKGLTLVDKFPAEYPNLEAKKIVNTDANELPFDDNKFDFLISCHCLEHCPNTIKTLNEWSRVIKKNGILFLVLPHGDRTFDKGREKTSLDHHINDYNNNVDIYDVSPHDEWENISLKADNPKWLENPKARNENGTLNFKWMAEDGKIHYHVWTDKEFIKLAEYLNLKVLKSLEFHPNRYDSFLIILQK